MNHDAINDTPRSASGGGGRAQRTPPVIVALDESLLDAKLSVPAARTSDCRVP
jgi:hypothetical protein